jgi:alpha-N-arabinofuranosidase
VLSDCGSEITLFVVNKHPRHDIEFRADLSGMRAAKIIEWVALSGHDPYTVNTAESSPVKPVCPGNAEIDSQGVSFLLPKASWNMLRLSVKS